MKPIKNFKSIVSSFQKTIDDLDKLESHNAVKIQKNEEKAAKVLTKNKQLDNERNQAVLLKEKLEDLTGLKSKTATTE